MGSDSTDMVVDMDLSDEELDDIYRGLIYLFFIFLFVVINLF